MDDEEGLGGKFWLKVVAIVVGCGIAALVVFAVFTAAAYRWGFFGAVLVFGVAMLVWAWFYDKKKVKEWSEETGE